MVDDPGTPPTQFARRDSNFSPSLTGIFLQTFHTSMEPIMSLLEAKKSPLSKLN